ncbi:flagellar basal body-associated FliL family protein [Clostridium cylindrosporum]|uniref:Flagellar protein FliL n=1 Tax=Clostridium cylindrosporum DSM 605 TaxID=1121307 RepID=A0A0J8DBM0_CLOCY|nr:flagellar basal body-associated FliL family protein [Clostridium cylindrosporum]KMT21709.1 flagellar basal body-associated protein [Clostridium cylindrosporum DSM 605]
MSEGKKKNPIMIILIILILAVASVGGYFAYTMFIKKPTGQKEEIKYVEKELVEKPMELEEFTVNLADEGGKSFIQTKLTLAYPEANKDLEKEVTSKLDKVLDIINSTLRQKKADDFNGNGLASVKKEILDKINENLISGRLTNIYVKKIVIQR